MLHDLIVHATIDDEKRRERARRARRQENLSNDGGRGRPVGGERRRSRVDDWYDEDFVPGREIAPDDAVPAWG